MKKALVLMSLLLAVTLLFSGCALIRSVLHPIFDEHFSTPAPTAVPTARPTPTPQPTPEPAPEEPAVEEPAVDAPAAEATAEPIVDVPEEPAAVTAEIPNHTWIAYEPLDDGSWAVYELVFLPSGDMTYMAGWYCSEIAYYGTGTWYASAPGTLEYSLTSSDGDKAGVLTYIVVNGDTLRLTHESGDSLSFIMEEEYGQEFVVKGSSMDQPPF